MEEAMKAATSQQRKLAAMDALGSTALRHDRTNSQGQVLGRQSGPDSDKDEVK